MKKRILSMLLAIVMVVGMLPATALTALAADGTTNTVTDFSVTNFGASYGWLGDTEEELDGSASISSIINSTEDVGKIKWEDGDEILVTLTSQKYGTQTVALIFDRYSNSWAADGYFRYDEGETLDISAIYAPCYERTADGSLQLKDGMQLGMTEYIAADCQIVDGTINISFDNATRNYSRLRIVGLPNQTLTVTTTGFTPAGATSEATEAYTLTTDDKGNAFLYGTFAKDATVSVKYGAATLAEFTFSEEKGYPNGTEQGKSYALGAGPIISGNPDGKIEASEDDITALVEQLKYYVDNGITTIIVTGEEPAMITITGDSYTYTTTAIGEAIYRLSGSGNEEKSTYLGKIDLILPDVMEIVDQEFWGAYALKSITLPKVTTLGAQAFYGCSHLQTITFGSVVTEGIENGSEVFYRVGSKVDGGLCDLVLNYGQHNAAAEYQPDISTKTWWNNTPWKSITHAHTGGTATCTALAVCKLCDASYGEVDADNHWYGAWTSNGDGTHTRTCSYNNTHTESVSCFGGMATCTQKAVCAICKTAYGELGGHTADPTYTPNAENSTKHNVTYSCCGTTVTENHSFGEDGKCACGLTQTTVGNTTITLGEYDSLYNGTEKKPAVTVVVNGVTLTEGTDYVVSYENNIYVGTATVAVTFKGNYTGEVTKTFTIEQDPKTLPFDGQWVGISAAGNETANAPAASGMGITLLMDTSSAAQTEYSNAQVEIVGQQVNLGSDIEMKYYVELGEGITIDQVKLRTVFLGVEKFLTTTETYAADDGRTLYVFTLEGITPQCMGDDIDAELYIGENAEPTDSVLDYSVADNLVSTFNNSGDSILKQLILDTLEYGAAAQIYRDYKTDDLVSAPLIVLIASDIDEEPPKSSPVLTKVEGWNSTFEATVRYSASNYICVTFMDGEAPMMLTSDAIAPYDFAKKAEFSVENMFTLEYSINDYCYAAYNNTQSSDAMKSLALALYNYGLSAHNYVGVHSGGTATCSHGKLCDVCGIEYDKTTNPTNHENKEEFTYTANADGTTHTKKYKCCGAVANASEAHDHTNGKCVCGVLPTPDYTVPTNLTATYGDTLANVTLPAGFTWQDAETTSVGNAGSNTFKVTYTPDDTENYKTVSDIEVTIQVAKADPEYTVPTDLTVYVGQTLNDIDLPSGWTWHPDAEPDLVFTSDHAGNRGAFAIYTPKDTLNYNTIEEDVYFTVLLLPIDGATVTVSGTHTYNGSAITPDVTVMIGEKTLTKNTDYTVSYSDNVNAGTATVTVTGKNDYTGTASTTFTIAKADSTVTTAPAAVSGLVYTGKAQTLITAGSTTGGELQYKVGDGEWSADLPEATNAGTYTVYYKVDGGNNYNDVAETSITVTIGQKNMAGATVTLDEDTFTYDGQPHKPGVTVTLNGKELTEGTDYVVTYRIPNEMTNNQPTSWLDQEDTFTNAGIMYYAVVEGMGNYVTETDTTLYANFRIEPKVVTAPTFAELAESYLYQDGAEIKPTFKLMDGSTEIPASEYSVSYSNNTAVGTATITVTDKTGGNYTVSGNATFEIVVHVHDWKYTADGDTITAECKGAIGTCSVENATVTIKLNAPENLTYDGNAKTVTVTQTPAGVFTDIPAVTYGESGNVNAGEHTASLTYGGVTASLTFTIERATISDVTATVTAPEAGAAPQTTVTAGTGYSAAISWDCNALSLITTPLTPQP